MLQTNSDGKVTFDEEGREAHEWFVRWLAEGPPKDEFDPSLYIDTELSSCLSEEDQNLFLEVLELRKQMLHERDP